ncbi:LLM class flavin-dependent oxidoreductase [Nitrosopumilus sp. S4]
MRIACSLGSLLTINQVLDCAQNASQTKLDSVWIPETWGMENFSMLSNVGNKATNQKIGSSIINIYSRSPSLIAMGAATTDSLLKGRLVLGLGTSSLPIVESFHGVNFESPLQRMKEYVEIIKLAISGKEINYAGKIFSLKNFSLLIKPIRNKIPIYIAAVNQKMVDLTWSIGDGVIFYLRPKNEMKETISKMQNKNKIDVSCQIITSISDNSDDAIDRAKKTIAFYVSVGKIYREFLANNGFNSEVKNIFEEYKKSEFRINHQLVSDKMIKSLSICGTLDECKQQLTSFRETGMDLPILQFNPVGDVLDSFNLFKKIFSDE